MKHLQHLHIKALIAVLLMAISVPLAHAASSFTVGYQNGKFTVTRSNTTGSETVLYRTVSLTALAGVHFTPVSGSLTFNDGDETLEVEVQEASSVPAIYRYQNTTNRSYKLEVLDINGFFLAQRTRSISYGTGSVVTQEKFNEVKSYTINSGEFKVTDSGYKQAYHSIPATSFYDTNVPKEYLIASKSEFSMLLEFEAREVDDGYQYVQILFNRTSTCDEGAGSGDPGPTDLSVYKAGFTHEGGKKNTNYKKYAFPAVDDHNYNYEVDDIGGRPNRAWNTEEYDYNDVGRLMKQFFKAVGTSYYYYRDFYGWLKMPIDEVNTVGVRFDASGDLDDDWMVKNLVAKVKVRDFYYPSVTDEGIVVSPGPYKNGNVVYISIPFDRIMVHEGDQPILRTSWGSLTYQSGSGSNVMTFGGVISAPAGTPLTINSFSGTIATFASHDWSLEESMTFNNYVVSEDYTLDDNTVITKLFDEPLIDDGVNKPRPFTVTWRGRTLVEGTDFTLSYADNRGPQTGTKDALIVITGKGKYHGTATGTFAIRAVELSDFNEIETGVYEIATREDLMHLSGFVTNGGNHCDEYTFRQTHDITDVGEFWPIAGPTRGITSQFKGHYDGQGFIISGIYVNTNLDPRFVGLFGDIEENAVVERIKLVNSTINAHQCAGPIAGFSRRAVIKNCYVGDDVTINSQEGYSAYIVGGITGENESTRVEGCVSAAVINAHKQIGGIVGDGYSARLKDNLYTGTSVISGENVGAILGKFYNVYPSYYFNNYYLDSNQPGAVTGTDVDGARFGRTITLGDSVSIVGDVVNYDVSGITAFGTAALRYNGTIYSGAEQTVVFAVNPPVGSGVTSVTVMNGNTPVEVTDNGDGTYSFVMPDASVTVNATFEVVNYTITVAQCEFGEVASDKQTAQAGETVTLTVAPANGFELDELTVMNGENTVETTFNEATGKYTFVMPPASVIVSATFQSMPVELSGVAFAGNNFASWYGDTDMTLPEDVTAYVVTGIDGDKALIEAVDYIPANVGVLLYSTTSAENVTSRLYTGETATVSSLLQGSMEVMDITDGYVLYGDNFVRTLNGSLAAHRCYLPVALAAGAPMRLRIVVNEDIVTAINDVRADGQVRYIDVTGRVSNRPFKGVNIVVDGDKVYKMVK